MLDRECDTNRVNRQRDAVVIRYDAEQFISVVLCVCGRNNLTKISVCVLAD